MRNFKIILITSFMLMLSCENPTFDPNEPNDSFENATEISYNVEVQGVIAPEGDIDFFFINTTTDSLQINFLLKFPSTLSPEIDIYNEEKELIGKFFNEDKGSTLNDSIYYKNSQKYYFKILPWWGSSSDEEYNLRINIKSVPVI